MRGSPIIAAHLHTLRTSLCSLPSTGSNGFEGLVEASFSRITGIPFRLSASGSQFGVDGKSAYEDPCICFECKLYSRAINKATVNAKLTDLALHNRGVDLWALCATTQVNAQIADNIRLFGERFAISTIVLDWPKNGLPPLAVMLAMASQTVAKFLNVHGTEHVDPSAVQEALNTINSDTDFVDQAERIRKSLTTPTIGLETARLASAEWLGEALADKQTARLRLEQPLSPGDSTEGTPQDRQYLVDKIAGFLSGPATSKVLYIIGEEGTGKSWSVAQSWLRESRKPMMLFISPSVFAETAAENDIQGLLVASIIRQTEGEQGPSAKEKWIKILSQLKRMDADHIRFVVVVDGVNQRPNKQWARTLDKLADELRRFGGQLIVTSRTSYFRNHIARVLALPLEEVVVPEWTQQERDAILGSHGIVGAELPVNPAYSRRSGEEVGASADLQ